MLQLALLSCLFMGLSEANHGAYNDIGAVYSRVVSHYNKHVLPKNSHDESVNVTFDLSLIQLDEIEDEDGELTAVVWLTQRWADPRLAWDPEEFNGVKRLGISSDDIWVPDTTIYNSVKHQEMVTVHDAVVMSTGDVTLVPSLRVRVSCPIREKSTNVTCEFQVGSWVYPIRDLDVYPTTPHVNVDTLYTNPRWRSEFLGSRRLVRVYDCCPESYASVVFTYRFSRNEEDSE